MSGDEGLRALAEASMSAQGVLQVRQRWTTNGTAIQRTWFEADRIEPEFMAFIAAANPTVVLALLDRLAAAEGAVERVREAASIANLEPNDSAQRTAVYADALLRITAAIDGTA